MIASVTAVLVGYGGSAETLGDALEALLRQTLPPEQIVCVDQSLDGRFDALLRERYPQVVRLRIEENLGYSSACNRAIALAVGDFLFFVNPDTHSDPMCLERLATALIGHPEAAIAGAQILLPDGRVNAGDNTLHLSGLAWAGHFGQPPEHGPPRPAAVCSGAALLVRRSAFVALGGYTEGFFMYHDDVELAWRARLEGWEVLFCPEATVVHDYEFDKGGYKWRYMERNRWWCLLAFLELRTLVLLAPMLVAVECAVWLQAATGGWAPEKRRAWRLLWEDRRGLWQSRRTTQQRRRIGDRPIVERMASAVDSPFLDSPAMRRVAPLMRAYRALVLAVSRR